MNISFDLDLTLIPTNDEFETEKRNWFAKLMGIEKIRKGSFALINELQAKGHQVHIYTTSYRSELKIRITLRYYGIRVNEIVSQQENARVLRSINSSASKYPPAFGFNLHIDDAKGVGLEGEKFGFKTIIVNPSEKNWHQFIITKLET